MQIKTDIRKNKVEFKKIFHFLPIFYKPVVVVVVVVVVAPEVESESEEPRKNSTIR